MKLFRYSMTIGVALLTLLGGWAVAGSISVSDDLFLGVWSPFAARWEKRVPVCVWSEDNESLYNVTGTGLYPGGNFELTNDIGDTVRYNVFWHTGNSFRQRERLRSNVPSRRSYRFDNDQNCPDGPSAEVRVRLNKRQIDRAIPGIYQDTLLFILSPL